MQLVTNSYLKDIIVRAISSGIQIRRAAQSNHLHYLQFAAATNDELWAFIQSIPSFDQSLRDFLLGKYGDSNTIISQTWETNFVIRVKQWADSHTWLYIDPMFSIGFYPQYITRGKDILTLPY